MLKLAAKADPHRIKWYRRRKRTSRGSPTERRMTRWIKRFKRWFPKACDRAMVRIMSEHPEVHFYR
ncbi:hypothetical protein [Mesoterricola silvestris]|uniref:Uncharacterized protein n=1 Tax=Mesoterricola silvestris TaxID=2927979 RepID=A0AA48GQU7_9BACT|nr:hypothetical protein [Mesoterricola silvestris]BDU72332.1 hypothetical protein METEAL_15060 [Mesoterricola silvestris]